MSEPLKYSKRIIRLHWITTLLIFVCIGTGINMEHRPDDIEKILLYRIHFSSGILVFLLTMWRVVAYFKDERPAPLTSLKKRHQQFIKGVHVALYVITILMCLTGIIGIFTSNLFPVALSGDVSDFAKYQFSVPFISHHLIAKFMFLSILIHLVGIVIHYIRKKENTLKRIS